MHIDNQYAAWVHAPPRKEVVIRVPPGTRKVSAYLERSEIVIPRTTRLSKADHLDVAFEEGADHILLVQAGDDFYYSRVQAYRMDSSRSAEPEKIWTAP